LSSEISLVSVGPRTIAHRQTETIVPLKKDTGGTVVVTAPGPVCHWLVGKSVAFVGVSAEILESTKTKVTHSEMTAAGHRTTIDAAFYGSLSAIEMNTTSKTAYLPMGVPMPDGWKKILDRQWAGFQCWEYMHTKPQKDIPLVFKRPSILDEIFPGLQDCTKVPEYWKPLQQIKNSSDGPVEIIRINMTLKKLENATRPGDYRDLLWRDSNGSFGFVLSNSASWRSATKYILKDKLLPSSEWVPGGVLRGELDDFDDSLVDRQLHMDLKGKFVFRRLRAILVGKEMMTIRDIASADQVLFPGDYIPLKRWMSLVESGFSLDTPFHLDFKGHTMCLRRRDPYVSLDEPSSDVTPEPVVVKRGRKGRGRVRKKTFGEVEEEKWVEDDG